MGQFPTCPRVDNGEDRFFAAIRHGNLDHVKNAVEASPQLLRNARYWRALTPLHLAASTGQLEVVIALLEQGAQVDALDRYGKTPLMLACKKRKWACADQLLDHGANVLVLGSSRGRTCLHYAAKGGNVACVQKILAAAASGMVANSWGVSRFVNIQDRNGITALHLASLCCHASIVHHLLSNGALVSARTLPSSHINGLGGGRSPLHAAARGGSVECVRELLAWGADRSHRDDEGFTAYGIANEYHNFACAALLNPNAAAPLVWPSPLKFMNELEPEAKMLLEAALTKANERQQQHRHFRQAQNQHLQERHNCNYDSEDLSQEPSGYSTTKDDDVCSICFEQMCTIQVQDCGHQMCATCTLRLCCHIKPDPLLPSASPLRAPACPFCRGNIGHLVLARNEDSGVASPSANVKARLPPASPKSPPAASSKSARKSRRKPASSGRIVDLSSI